MSTLLAAAQSSAPAGGAELAQVIGASAAASVLTAGLLSAGLRHRSGRGRTLGRLAGYSSRVSGLPEWASLPSAVAAVALVTAAIGLYWDVSLHIDNGRDAGPLANPSHYLILAGLFGIFSAGWLAMVLASERPGPASVRLVRGWQVPVSGVLMMACASFALMGFPLDDVSHRLFGQDVTLWGPTHLMMLGGAAMTLVAILGLLAEGRAAARQDRAGAGATPPPTREAWLDSSRMRAVRLVSACGGLLIGLSIFQGEFDYGVPQFSLLYHPVLIAVAAAIPLVVARTIAGPGAALGAVAFFLAFRGSMALLVGGALEETLPHFPLYVVEALAVEALALALRPDRGYRFGAAAGGLIGSVGVVAEWGWTHVFMPIPWPGHILPEAIALSLPAAVGAGLIGSYVGGALRRRPEVAGARRGLAPAAGGLLAIAAVLGFLLPTSTPDVRASVDLREVSAAGEPREVLATVRFAPAEAVVDAHWIQSIAWQGQEPLRVEALEEVDEGVYRSAPLPVSGSWKTVLRLHRGRDLASAPVYLPADPDIPAAGVSARPSFERDLVADHELLQRERKDDVPGWLFGAAGLVVAAITAALLALFGWGLARIARSRESERTPPAPPTVPVRPKAGAGVV